MKRFHFEKGLTGELLRDIRSHVGGPFAVRREFSGALIRAGIMNYITLTVRGSSKCRRKQSRQLERWLNQTQPT